MQTEHQNKYLNMTQLTHQTSNWEKRTFPISILLYNFNIQVNIGSVFRLADAFGCEHIYLSGTSATPPTRKITKTARAADKYVPFSYHDEPFELVSKLKSDGYRIVSLELTTISQPLSDLSLDNDEKLCLILGSENEGVEAELLELSDEVYYIPMYGEKSSLNVATAAGIALYSILEKMDDNQ